VRGEGPPAQLRLVTTDELSRATAQTPGMERLAAVSAGTVGSLGLWMGQTVMDPATRSSDHHHGESETAIFVVSGRPEFVYLDQSVDPPVERRLRAGPGDYVYVPPWVPHREENPDPEDPAVVVIARTTQEAIVVNLPDLGPPG